ncbi:MAG: TetR/AcrR family transcriptional regulator [Micromonosporaceae bacterium]|nr:TetR/AcrR family transcriptional regulator [Micromonosporaceae bacterium]
MTKRGPYSKGITRRDEILTVALRLFAENGYRGTSLREIARECGLSAAGLCHYFGSKEDLFVAVLDKRDEVDSERAGRHEGLLDAIVDVIERNAEVPGLVELYTTMAASASDPGHPASAFFARHYEATRSAVRQRLVRAQEHGELPPRLDPDRLAVLLTAVMDGLQIQWTVDGSLDMSEHLRLLWQILEGGMCSSETPAVSDGTPVE